MKLTWSANLGFIGTCLPTLGPVKGKYLKLLIWVEMKTNSSLFCLTLFLVTVIYVLYFTIQ